MGINRGDPSLGPGSLGADMFDATAVPKLLTFMVAVVVFECWERARPSRRIDRRRHLGLDLLGFAVVVMAGLVWPRLLGALFESLEVRRALVFLTPLKELPSVAKVTIGIVMADFCLYWVHRWMHGPAVLWRAHLFHHSTQQLYWLSGARTSLFHLLLFAIPQIVIARYVLDLSIAEAAVGFSIGVVINLWVHTNVSVNLGPLEWLIVTPDFHRAHHARDISPTRNIGFLLTVWDRLFGTYLDPHQLEREYPLGLTADQPPVSGRMIAGL